MRNQWLLFGALLVISGIVSIHLSRKLGMERQANAELSAQLAAPKTAEGVPPPTTQSITIPPPTAMPVCPAAATVPVDPRVVDLVIRNALELSGNVPDSNVLIKDPEYRKAQLTILRKRLVQNSPGLAETLGLSSAEADHLFDVLAEAQLNRGAELNDPDAALKGVLRQSSAGNDPLQLALGAARYAQYDDYRRNVRPALVSVKYLGDTLTSNGQPMSDSQSRALTTALLAEQQRQRQEAAPPLSIPDSGATRGTIGELEENNNRNDEASRRILAAAVSSLSPAQQQVLREKFEKEAATRRRTIETARRELGRGFRPLTQLPGTQGTNR
jgi:hypothetical protein